MTKKSLHKKKNNSKNVHKELTPLERYKTLIAAGNFHYDTLKI